MSTIAEVLEFTRSVDSNGFHVSEAKCDLGGGNIVTAVHYSPPNDDSHPLPGDFAVLVEGAGRGCWIAVGFMDPKLAPSAGPGERIVYSRSAPGIISAKIHLKADGSIELNGGAVVLGIDGTLTVANDVIAGGKSLKTHVHVVPSLTVSTGGTAGPGNTQAPS